MALETGRYFSYVYYYVCVDMITVSLREDIAAHVVTKTARGMCTCITVQPKISPLRAGGKKGKNFQLYGISTLHCMIIHMSHTESKEHYNEIYVNGIIGEGEGKPPTN